MANVRDTLSHTKWLCKYHIVFTPKYRRKAIYGQYKESIGKILRQLCNYKGVEIIEGHLMPDHIHMPARLQKNRGSLLSFSRMSLKLMMTATILECMR